MDLDVLRRGILALSKLYQFVIDIEQFELPQHARCEAHY
jgi:hypothetical protein